MNTAASMAFAQDTQPPATVIQTVSNWKNVAVTSMIYVLKASFRIYWPLNKNTYVFVYCNHRIFSLTHLFTHFFPTGSPLAPTAVTVSAITSTSAVISWAIPIIPSTAESYFVTYGLDPSALISVSPTHNSGFNAYTQLLAGLDPSETYYFRVVASNAVGASGSDIDSFMTLSGRK